MAPVLTLADSPIASGRTLIYTTHSLIKENLGNRTLDQTEYIECVAVQLPEVGLGLGWYKP